MIVHRVNPILNVSDLRASLAWFATLGWSKTFEWGEPADFAGIRAGAVELFLCENAQGGRGRGTAPRTFGPDGDETGDRGAWMMLWVDDVDALHGHCIAHGIEVVWPPTDMPWGAREMHVRHPDGHVFRFGQGSE